MFMSMTIKVPILDVEELDRLCKLKKLSRSQYIRFALEYYNENPILPVFVKGNDLARGEPVRPIGLMLKSEHIDIINTFQTKYNATKVQIIRQAIIEEAIRDGETFKTIAPHPINPMWEGIWVKATNIYGQIGMHRNSLYGAIKSAGLESHSGSTTSRHPEKWYLLTDITRIYRLDDIQAGNLAIRGICFLQ